MGEKEVRRTKVVSVRLKMWHVQHLRQHGLRAGDVLRAEIDRLIAAKQKGEQEDGKKN